MKVDRIYDTALYSQLVEHRELFGKDEAYDEALERLKFIRQNMARAANRGELSQDIQVSVDYVYDVGERQGWECALSGHPLEFTRGGTMWGGKWCNPKSCTIDRIDSTKGYVEGNIQLICWDVNCIKRDLPESVFIDLVTDIAMYCNQ